MARLGARIRKGTMETLKTLGTAAVARSPMSPVTNVAKAFSVPGMLQSPTVGQGLKTTNGNMVRLGDVCHILNGYAFRSEKYVCSGVRIIRIANVQKGYVEDSSPVFYPLDNNELYKYELFEDDLLMSLTGNVGRVALLQKEFLPAALNQRVACLRIKDETVIGKRFLFNFLNSDYFETKCIESSKGVAQKNMSTEWLKNYKVPLFSFEEQEKISSELDKISHLITLRKRQLSKLDELVKSRFVEMFGDIKTNPKKFASSTLKDICDSYFWIMPQTPRYIENGEIPYITSKNIKGGRIELKGCKYISRDDYNILTKNRDIKSGDFLISMIGTLGEVSVVQKQDGLFYGQNIFLLRLKKDINSQYVLSYLTNTDYVKHWWDKCKNSSTQSYLKSGHITGLKILIPPFALQREFAAFVAKVDKLAFKVKASLEKLETLKKAMMQKYFN